MQQSVVVAFEITPSPEEATSSVSQVARLGSLGMLYDLHADAQAKRQHLRSASCCSQGRA